jgi:hypothetical protein
MRPRLATAAWPRGERLSFAPYDNFHGSGLLESNGRGLVKFIGAHAEYDRIDPKDRVMAKKKIRPVRTEAEYDVALEEIERYFESEPKPGTPEADRFDLLALIIEDYERKRWPIDPPETIDAIRYRMETGGYT